MPKSINWCLTINNPEESDDEDIKTVLEKQLCTYLVYQKEQGEKATPHYQIFIQMKVRTTHLRMSRLFPRAHCEVMFKKSSPSKCRDYCTKEEGRLAGPFEHGVIDETVQGQRTDLDEVYKMCQEAQALTSISETHCSSWFKYQRSIITTRNMYIPVRNFKTQVTVIWGYPGVGKTFWAMNSFPKPYKMNDYGDQLFMADYEPMVHETVVFDDFHGNMKFSLLKQLCDEYQETVQTKGGFVPFRAKHIVFTSQTKPESWYKCFADPNTDWHWQAFNRRMENVIYVEKDKYHIRKGQLLFPFTQVPAAPENIPGPY